MRNDRLPEIPAAVPLLLYCLGLALARLIVNPPQLLRGCASIALLLLFTGRRWRYAAALSVLSLAAGLVTAGWEFRTDSALSEVAAAHERQFVRIEAPIRAGWEREQEGQWVMRTDRFTILPQGAAPIPVGRSLTIYLATEPDPVGSHPVIRAEGFLRLSSGKRSTLSVKSSRLVSTWGKQRVWDPALLNRRLAGNLDSLAGGDESLQRPAALVKAIVLGRSGQLPEDIRDSYRRGGTYHLLVFSGMQIALVAAFLSLAFRWLGRPRGGDWMLLATALLAPWFAGNEPSITRASAMVGLYAVSRILHRPTSVENLLFVSALLRLIAHPGEIDDAGFALTYAATGGLILLGKPLARAMAERRLPLTQLGYGAGAELATAPLTLLFFHQIVLGSSLVTALIAPFLSLMFALGCFACAAAVTMPGAATLALRAIALLDVAATRANLLFSETFHLLRFSHAPGLAIVLMAFLATAILRVAACRRPALVRVCWVPLIAPLIAAWLGGVLAGRIAAPRIEALDVGQGDSILVRDGAGEVILVDGGGRAGNAAFGRSVLLPLLLDRGVGRIDAVALSHPHPDHCEGLIEVVQSLDVRELWLSARHVREECTQRLLGAARARDVPVRLLDRSPSIAAGTMVIRPIVPRLRFKRSQLNNTSLLLRIRFESGLTALLAGDIERDAERLLTEEQAPLLQADILKVPHHGSRSSSTAAFLAVVRPRLAVVSCGRGNPFGHPGAEVLVRLRETAPVILRTDREGTVMVELRGREVVPGREIDTP